MTLPLAPEASPEAPQPAWVEGGEPRREVDVAAERRRFGPLAPVFVTFFTFAVAVLALGVVAAVAETNPALHDRLHDAGLSTGVFGRVALRMADSSHRTESAWQLALDYGFSAANLGLAAFLFWLRPRDRTAGLLALGLVGTGAVFNLQAHAVYEAFPPTMLEALVHDSFAVVTAVSYALALLLFPDGRLVPRWRPPAVAAFYAGVAAVAVAATWAYPSGSRTVTLVMVFGLLTPAAGVLAQGYRYRRSGGDQLLRQQARLLFWAMSPAMLVSLYALTIGVWGSEPQLEGRALVVLPVTLFRVFQPVFLIIPVALLVGIFRFRLWNIDRLISRTLVYGFLAGFVSAVYVGVVVGVGSLVGASQRGDLGLSILATFLVAVAFQPVKERVQRLANRLVYGRRATPYEVLSGFVERVAESVPTEELLSRMARLLAEGTGATRADVWLKVGDELRLEASWPPGPGGSGREALAMPGDDLPHIPGASRTVAVFHQDATFGALSVSKPANEQLTPTEEKLLADLGHQAGLVLRNLRLTAELVQRLEELKASRQRLLTAQDEARRRLERNLHDGAQQHLVALKVHLTLAEDIADELGEAAEPLLQMLGQLKTQAGEALEELRDLARGIYPPLLAAEGLPAALASQARKAPLPVKVQAEGVGRYSQEIEAAVYFCCLEGIQNVIKYAGSCSVDVRLVGGDGTLEFNISDDGCGFDPATAGRGAGSQNMADRVEALEGHLQVASAPGHGTTVTGRIPASPL